MKRPAARLLDGQQRLRPQPGDPVRRETASADLVAFGKPFIANPDLVERLKDNAPLNTRSGNVLRRRAKGYTDYPALEQQVA
jgi:2,4-dienoyl-CoA reductase-like NADH-dependent reductase (Old Yellow Enzyme family)